jgi:hypothetical protein
VQELWVIGFHDFHLYRRAVYETDQEFRGIHLKVLDDTPTQASLASLVLFMGLRQAAAILWAARRSMADGTLYLSK